MEPVDGKTPRPNAVNLRSATCNCSTNVACFVGGRLCQAARLFTYSSVPTLYGVADMASSWVTWI